MLRNPAFGARPQVVECFKRSALEIEGSLLAKHPPFQPHDAEAHDRIQVHQEFDSNDTLQIAIVVGDNVLLQMADFAQSNEEANDLFSLFHDKAIVGLAFLKTAGEANLKRLSK